MTYGQRFLYGKQKPSRAATHCGSTGFFICMRVYYFAGSEGAGVKGVAGALGTTSDF